MEPVYFIIEGRDSDYVFGCTGWSHHLVDGGVFATEADARAELASLVASGVWDRIDLRVGKRVRHPAAVTRVA